MKKPKGKIRTKPPAKPGTCELVPNQDALKRLFKEMASSTDYKTIDHGNIEKLSANVKTIEGIFKKVCTLSEEELFFNLVEFLDDRGYDNVEVDDENYIVARGEIPILLNAHVDTVFCVQPDNLYVTDSEMVFTTDIAVDDKNKRVTIGIGADDRSGIAMIIHLVNLGYRPHILITRGEETGSIGAKAFVKKFQVPPFDVKYIIALDRSGKNDAVYYDLKNQKFKNYVKENFGFEDKPGKNADIKELAPAWNVAAVNLSTGYENHHKAEEFEALPVLRDTASRVARMLDNPPAERYEFMPEKDLDAYKKSETERIETRTRSSRKSAADKNFAYKYVRERVFKEKNMVNYIVSKQGFMERGFTREDSNDFERCEYTIARIMYWFIFNFAIMKMYYVDPSGNVVEANISFDSINRLSVIDTIDDYKDIDPLHDCLKRIIELDEKYPRSKACTV